MPSVFVDFDPARVAYFEKENYVAYYQRRWLRLLRVSVALVREAFGLNLRDGVVAAYLVARAEMAFAPFPKNDPDRAEAYMQRFYDFLNRRWGTRIDSARAARLDVRWWQVHREHFAVDDFGPLAEALTDWLALVYDAPRDMVADAARLRAYGMVCSDRWVRAGMPKHSALLEQEEAALAASYRALRAALLMRGVSMRPDAPTPSAIAQQA